MKVKCAVHIFLYDSSAMHLFLYRIHRAYYLSVELTSLERNAIAIRHINPK